VKITWSPLAIRRVIEAAEFIARDKPAAAQRWTESTFSAVERLAEWPRSGRVVPELGRAEVREVIHGSYRIIYRIAGDEVLILNVRHARRRLDPEET